MAAAGLYQSSIHSKIAAGALLAAHPRASTRGSWVVDPAHWDGLPVGDTRGTVIELPTRPAPPPCNADADETADGPLPALLTAHLGADIAVARRPLADYALAGTVR